MPRRPGPNRQPAEVIELHGNPAGLTKAEIEDRRQNDVKARPLRPTVPNYLSPYARECWNMLAPELESLGLLSVLDAPGFILCCETWAIARYALDDLRPRKADGTPDGRTRRPQLVDRDESHAGNSKKHPAAAIYFQAAALFNRYCVEFGLSPSARVALRPGARPTVPGGTPGEDEDREFFGT
jgi:P27 family predicted phage terminase small subunit